MKTITFYLLLGFTLMQFSSFAQTREVLDDANGDWTEQYVVLTNTPEADMMVRTGDIDNLGFGWPEDFDPFSGKSTYSHGYPWEADSSDAMGTDRIMVVSSYDGNPPAGSDGYTAYTSRPENLPRPIVMSYDLNGMELTSAMMQIFVDDFQANLFQAHYFVTINGVDAPFAADIINQLSQTGPIGKIINVAIPENYLYLLEQDSLSILIDDTTTGAGDGYAIDFVKLLMNPKGFSYTAAVYGIVTDIETGDPIENAIVSASGTGEILTDAEGYFIFNKLPAGITNLLSTKFSYDTAYLLLDLISGDSVRHDFQLREVLEAEFSADNPVGSTAPHMVQFTDMTSMNPNSWVWDFGDGATSEEQNPSHEYTETGIYTVSLEAGNGDETNTKIKVDYIRVGVDGIGESSVLSGFNVAPNPVISTGILSFTLRNSTNISIEIVDFTGKVVKNVKDVYCNKGECKISFSTEGLPDGIYFVCVKTGSNTLTKKIMVLSE